MKTIYKYQMVARKTTFDLPLGAEFRALALQDDLPTLWFEVETNRKTEKRTFKIFVTGGVLPGGVLWFCGTYQLTEPEIFVGHVYEIRDGAKPSSGGE